MKRSILLVAVGALMLTAACGGEDAGEEAAADTGGSVTLTAVDFEFDPTDVTASAGDTIELTNEDDALHSFTAEDAGIDEDVDPSGSASITLEGVEAGEYEFVCKYHPEMTGILTVR